MRHVSQVSKVSVVQKKKNHNTTPTLQLMSLTSTISQTSKVSGVVESMCMVVGEVKKGQMMKVHHKWQNHKIQAEEVEEGSTLHSPP